LRRWNRSKGFSAKSARHRKEHEDYIFLQGLDCKISSFLHGCCTGASCRPKLERFRPWESTGSGGKERGEGGGSIPCLTRSGDAPRRSNFMEKDGTGGSVHGRLFCAVLFLLMATPGHQWAGQGQRTGGCRELAALLAAVCRAQAWAKRAGARGRGGAAASAMQHKGRAQAERPGRRRHFLVARKQEG
jgi:hypothetical protein